MFFLARSVLHCAKERRANVVSLNFFYSGLSFPPPIFVGELAQHLRNEISETLLKKEFHTTAQGRIERRKSQIRYVTENEKLVVALPVQHAIF